MGPDSLNEAALASREPLNATNYFLETNIPEQKKAVLLKQHGLLILRYQLKTNW
jgi:hypothetical protein